MCELPDHSTVDTVPAKTQARVEKLKQIGRVSQITAAWRAIDSPQRLEPVVPPHPPLPKKY